MGNDIQLMSTTPPLCERTCVPCRGGVPPLPPDESRTLAAELDGWSVIDNRHIEKSYAFQDFRGALRFVNAVAGIAEEQGHHPDMHLSWDRVAIRIWTHKIDGLTESDFVLAAKIDQLPRAFSVTT